MGRWITPALIGIATGTALQLQQAALWPVWIYACLAAAGAAICFLRRWPLLAFVATGVLAFSLTGLRALDFESHALDPALEGKDITVTGVIAAMPQRNESGLRFRFEVEEPRTLPPQIYLGWY